jgi:hypothetical protein
MGETSVYCVLRYAILRSIRLSFSTLSSDFKISFARQSDLETLGVHQPQAAVVPTQSASTQKLSLNHTITVLSATSSTLPPVMSTFQTLRQLHAIIGTALSDIETNFRANGHADWP